MNRGFGTQKFKRFFLNPKEPTRVQEGSPGALSDSGQHHAAPPSFSRFIAAIS